MADGSVGLPARIGRWIALAPHVRGKSRLEAILLPRLPLPVSGLVQMPDGFQMKVDPKSSYERDLYFRACEPDTYAFVRTFVQPGMTIVDCGANLGFYTLLAATLAGPRGRIFSFEPTRTTVALLRANVELNRLSQVTVSEVALGDAPGEGRLWQMRDSEHGLNTLINGYGDGRDLGTCPIDTLDAMLSNLGAPPPHLIKIDVEGSELALARGAERTLRAPRGPVLIIELSSATMRPFGYEPEDLVQFLLSIRDYEVLWPHRGNLEVVRTDRPLPHYRVLGRHHGSNYVFRPLH